MTETKPMLSFPEAIKSCLRQYVGFAGRATRAEYWWWVLGFVVVSILLGILNGIIFGFEPDDTNVFGVLFILATLLPWWAVTARRLHDTGRTGWWQLVWIGVGIMGVMPYAVARRGVLISVFNEETYIWQLLAGLLISITVWIGMAVWQIWWLASQGQLGPNRYGPDPRS